MLQYLIKLQKAPKILRLTNSTKKSIRKTEKIVLFNNKYVCTVFLIAV